MRGKGCPPVDVVAAEHSVGMAMRDVVVVGYDLELNEPHAVIESCKCDKQCRKISEWTFNIRFYRFSSG